MKLLIWLESGVKQGCVLSPLTLQIDEAVTKYFSSKHLNLSYDFSKIDTSF